MTLSYSPNYVYNHRTDDSAFEHYLDLFADRTLSDRLQLTLRDTYEKTDDSTLGRDETRDSSNRADRINLTENRSRYRYWTNYLDINGEWLYAQNSSLVLGYNYSIFDTDRPDEGYQRHSPRFSINHEINQQWSVGGEYSFAKGDFDQTDDTTQHSINGRLAYHLSQHKTVYGFGEYDKTDYDQTGIDYYIAGGRLGYNQQIGQQTAMDIAAGYASTERDDDSSTDAFNYSLSLTRQLEKGSFSLSGDGGFDQRQFDGEDSGLSKFWSVHSTLNYQLTERLSSGIYALYRNDDYLENIQRAKEDSYEAGGGLNWSFSRWYAAGIRYVYHKVEADVDTFDYDDHRLYLTLSASKELWKL